MGCQSGYRFPFNSTSADFDDAFVRKEFFSEGGLWTWGDGAGGILGTNAITVTSSPVQTVSGGTNWKQVSGALGFSAGIKSDGTLWVWGCNLLGRLGDNTSINRSSPVQTISGGTNWKKISIKGAAGSAIKTDGSLWLWGSGSSGQLGNNSTVFRSSPVQTVSGGTDWKEISSGSNYVAATKTDGTLWLWGDNANGQIGIDSTISYSSPVQTISGGTDWKYVDVAGASSTVEPRHTAAIKTDGTLWLWGSAIAGQLGTNNRTTRSSPVQTVSGGTNWKQVSVGTNHTAAIKTDGTLWLWGCNVNGHLGTNNRTTRSSPVQTVSGGTNWKQVSAGVGDHTAAIKTDGTLWLWGSASSDIPITGSAVSRSSPVQTVSGGTNWKQVSLGEDHIVTIREDCW